MMKNPQQATRENAQGIVEFALVLPLLLALLLGVIEVGRMLFIYSAVTTSAREAVRYGSSASNYQDCSGIRAAARRMGSLAGVKDSDVVISYDDGPGTTSHTGCPPSFSVEGGVSRIVVVVSTTYNPIVPLLNLKDLDFSSTSTRTLFMDVALVEPDAVSTSEVLALHLGNLAGGNFDNGSSWSANVTITVHDQDENPVEGVTVSGTWSSGDIGSTSCTTGSDGKCVVYDTGISGGNVFFNVNDLTKSGFTYDSNANDVSEKIKINKP